MSLGEYFGLDNPAFQSKTDENGNTVSFAERKAIVLWKEDVDHYIMDETIKMLRENGITDLYVLNRDFILEAIREKVEREEKPWK